MGCSNKIAAAVVSKITSSGVKNKSKISGMLRCNFFSSQEEKATTSNTAMMPPRPGKRGSPQSLMSARPGWLMMTASVPPSIGEPPNSLAALTPTKILMPQNAALPAICSSCMLAVCPSPGSNFKRTLSRPVTRPQAMKAGINGRKILEILFNSSLNGVAFFCRIFA